MASSLRRASLFLLMSFAAIVLLVFLRPSHYYHDRNRLSITEPMAVGPPAAAGDGPAPAAGDDPGDCSPRSGIFFLKTHKCGSSTVQNILMRYGERHALNFVLPGSGNYLGSPAPFREKFVPDWLWPRSGKFDIFTHHTRLNIPETRRVMRDGAAWVTILREPTAQFESAFDYYHLGSAWKVNLTQFIALPLEKKKAFKRLYGRFGASQMAFDLGYDPEIVSDERLVQAMLDDLDAAFDLVMIADMMDESLVLLRQLMCWSIDDVAYLTKNARFDGRRAKLGAADRAALREFLALDVILYEHFRRRLAERIRTEPLDVFLAQSEALVARRGYWKQRCVTSEVKGNQLGGQQREIADVKGYKLSDKSDWMCSRLGMAELGYTDLMRDQQRERQAVWRRVEALLEK